ncbi:MAG: hypothetical protein K8I02_06415, partial [Candidatus Methylomirabilis sp.]|nr:hypothetical protein [Deltaproteobacteria bacterium]
RETILVFSAPVADGALPGAISAEAGDASLFFTQRVSADRTRITLFYQNDLPAGARVRVTVRGNQLHDDQGVPFDANGAADGTTAVVSFDTIPLATVAGTAVCGRIFASEVGSAPGGATVDAPLEGVTVTVDGTENDFMPLQAVTDAMGDFCLDPAPAGTFFVHFDGRTVTNIPAGAPAVCQADPSPCYYPFVGKALSSVPGVTTSTMMGMPIQIYLPLVLPDVLQPVSATPGVDTTIGFPASVLEAAPPELQDIFAKVSITVPGGSLYHDDGSPGAMVGIAPVPSDRMPGPMPNGVEQPLVITVQTDGASNFDIPVSACFPNVGPKDPDTGEFTPGAPPGAKSALWSFDHDKGTFEVIG